jgi:hypothetical protein
VDLGHNWANPTPEWPEAQIQQMLSAHKSDIEFEPSKEEQQIIEFYINEVICKGLVFYNFRFSFDLKTSAFRISLISVILSESCFVYHFLLLFSPHDNAVIFVSASTNKKCRHLTIFLVVCFKVIMNIFESCKN